MGIKNPALPLVKEIREIVVFDQNDVKEMAAMLSTGKWIAIAAAQRVDSCLISMGRVV